MKKWKTLKSRHVFKNKWIKIRQDTCQLSDGRIIKDYYVWEKNDWGLIFALTEDSQVILTRQYKHGIDEIVLELPAGGFEGKESPEEGMRRELKEETGYVTDDMEKIGIMIHSPTECTSKIHVFLARGARKVGKSTPDIKENIQVELVGLDKIIDRVRNGEITVQSHIAGIYMALDKLGKLSFVR